MGRYKIPITKQKLIRLYIDKKLTPQKIGELLGCSFATVRNRMKEFGITFRRPSIARQRFDKKDFSGDPVEEAYLIGFRVGDLNVYVPNLQTSNTLVARCHTTDIPQVKLMKAIFSQYGAVRVSKSIHGYSINCYLNRSFDFLLPKKRPERIDGEMKVVAAFVAGYVDAEGNFIVNQGRGRFKLDSYDVDVLFWMDNWLKRQNIKSLFRQIARKGDTQYIRGKLGYFHENLWRINVNEAKSLKRFIGFILPYLKHSRRIQQAKQMLANIEARIRYGSVKDS